VDQSLTLLPAKERARRYREFGAAAMEEALAAATDELRHEYLCMAASWHAQATELEKE
jgi:hypothetical protein